MAIFLSLLTLRERPVWPVHGSARTLLRTAPERTVHRS